MPSKTTGARVTGERHTIRYAQTQSFFNSRGITADSNPLTATMYQNALLASRRDEAEKQKILPMLDLRSDDRVLDLGCGAGRWAEAIAPRVADYLGIDFSESLLEAARGHVPGGVFQQMPVNALNPAEFCIAPPFSLFVCSGILAYLNDTDVLRLFDIISRIAAAESRIYLREPVAKIERLTLDEYWSDELKSSYSAIYRTRAEYADMFRSLTNFRLRTETAPFDAELQNRVETEQRCFLLERRSAQ
jgi:SAM-dependent methyltransferase